MFDPSERERDLSRDKFLPPKWGFVIEQNAGRRMDLAAFAIADSHPMAVKLGYGIWATRSKRRDFGLWHFGWFSEHLRG